MAQSIMKGGHGILRRVPEENALAGKNIGRQKEPPLFGQMFPSLADKPLTASDAALKDLADAMLDDGTNTADNAKVPAGFTYLGQFIDHDITLDTTSIGEVIDDPLSVENFRTPALDLDSVYGLGPGASKSLYDRNDDAKFVIGPTQDVGGLGVFPNDLPRDRQGFALIGDHRNDENLLVAQTHLAFLKFHNKVVDHLRAGPNPPSGSALFREARRIVTWHYQWIVLFDFVERITEPGLIAKIKHDGRKFYRFRVDGRPFMPVEFAAAIYRLGHSMVRQTYNHNRVFPNADFSQMFTFTGLSGNISGAGLETFPSNWIIDWRRFYEFGPAAGGIAPNASRKIDPFLAQELHALPGGASLPFLNLKRGVLRKLPSGQDVAKFMKKHVGEPLLTPDEIATGSDGAAARQHGLHQATPLWYYILKEAAVRHNGERMGPYGSRMLAEVFLGIVAGDVDSFIRDENPVAKNWNPSKEPHPLPARNPGKYTMVDLLEFVGDLNPLG